MNNLPKCPRCNGNGVLRLPPSETRVGVMTCDACNGEGVERVTR